MITDWAHVRDTRTVFEDADAVVIDKPAGVALTGARDGDDLMAAARAAGEWVMPAHRIDRVTSGLVLLARSREAHAGLTQQFRERTIDKRYLAVVRGIDLPERGTIDLPLRVGRKNSVRVAGPREAIEFDEWSRRWALAPAAATEDARTATTTFERLSTAEERTLLCVRPVTGRRHQIRVHFGWIGFPIIGDPLFAVNDPDADSARGGGRTRLHSWQLAFDDAGGERVHCRRDPDPEFFVGFSVTPALLT